MLALMVPLLAPSILAPSGCCFGMQPSLLRAPHPNVQMTQPLPSQPWSLPTTDQELIEGEDVSNLRLIAAVLRHRMRSLAAPDFNKLRLAFSSVITQVGAQAFFFISSALALMAVCTEQVARRVRRFDTDGVAGFWRAMGPQRWQRLVARVQSRAMESLGKLRYEAMASSMFDEVADLNKDLGVDRTELYCLCLRLYLTVTQFLPQVLTPPTKAQCDDFFSSFDLDRDGRLDKEEFLVLASLLIEMLAIRIATQSIISLVLAPLVAARFVPIVGAWHLPFSYEAPKGLFGRRAGVYTVGSMVTAGVTAVGAVLPGSLGAIVTSLATARAGAITASAAIIVALLVPLSLSLIDDYYSLRSARTASQALRAARERRLKLRKAQLAYEDGGEDPENL